MLRSFGRAGAVALALFCCAPASAFDVARDDHGGRVEPYTARLVQADARGEQIRIGAVECDSSCTLYLHARRACVAPGAVLGFHAPWIGGPSGGVPDANLIRLFASSYKPALCKIFLAHVDATADTVPGPLLKLSGRQLAGLGYRLCGENVQTRTASRALRPTPSGFVPPPMAPPAALGYWPEW